MAKTACIDAAQRGKITQVEHGKESRIQRYGMQKHIGLWPSYATFCSLYRTFCWWVAAGAFEISRYSCAEISIHNNIVPYTYNILRCVHIVHVCQLLQPCSRAVCQRAVMSYSSWRTISSLLFGPKQPMCLVEGVGRGGEGEGEGLNM